METQTLKEEAKRMIDQLPDNFTWEDLMYQIYVRQTIEAGLKDSKANQRMTVEKVRAKFGLSE